MSDKKTSSIGSRIDPHLRLRLNEITRRYGPNDARMLTDALLALCDYVEANQAYRSPVKMIFDAETDEFQRLRVADGPSKAAAAAAETVTQRLRKEEKERAAKHPPARK